MTSRDYKGGPKDNWSVLIVQVSLFNHESIHKKSHIWFEMSLSYELFMKLFYTLL